ncbi:2-succinylbenzoate--CoA ligase [Gracilariopsis chorda]|uniref:2-succinylbenzoate--CoA ligase n=1 Tax=Gracilariopsis chorda TaxID=448386 RepID=A0A2V3J5F0_9FLOR|nr:2-succinylbenzoate--CoA ligase [Gracilariopsis chorda]|eukprot:PXF49227.1 2-succinylbenzoate--CoA ligase [Gracilariopsis chorda]
MSILHKSDGTTIPLQHAVSHFNTCLAPHLHIARINNRRLRVALFRLPPETALASTFALHTLSCTPVFLNDRWGHNELQLSLQTFPVSLLITTAVEQRLLSAVLADLPDPPALLILQNDGTFSCSSSPQSLQNALDLPMETCAVFFTSGTSGTPKAVPLTFRNIQVQSRFKQHSLRLSPTSVYLHLAPLCHLSGFSSSHAAALSHAHHVFPPSVLHASEKSQAQALLNFTRRTRVTHLVAVPATLQLLCDAAQDIALPDVRVVLYGGARADAPLVATLSQLCPHASVLGAYGMSEAASSVIMQEHPERAYILPHFAARIVDTSTGRTCKAGERDTIRSAGETVWPVEVEDALTAHPIVKEAVVVGVPHRVLGEAVVAAVVLMVREAITGVVTTLMKTCRESLAHYKCPKRIVVTEYLPRNANGKVSRADVRRMFGADRRAARM